MAVENSNLLVSDGGYSAVSRLGRCRRVRHGGGPPRRAATGQPADAGPFARARFGRRGREAARGHPSLLGGDRSAGRPPTGALGDEPRANRRSSRRSPLNTANGAGPHEMVWENKGASSWVSP
jgi:hypothetical protein